MGWGPRPDAETPGVLTGLVLCEGDDVRIVVVDEARELAGLATAHADLTVPPLACPLFLSEGHQTSAKEEELWVMPGMVPRVTPPPIHPYPLICYPGNEDHM